MKRIVLAIDLKPNMAEFMEKALELLTPFAPQIELVHALPNDPEFSLYESDLQLLRDNLSEVYRVHHARVLECAAKLREKTAWTVHVHVVQGEAVDVILEHASTSEADLIVVGSYGHGALYRTLLGSVSDGLLHKAKIPLYVIPLTTD